MTKTKTKFFTLLPDGGVATRSSVRPYTHAVATQLKSGARAAALQADAAYLRGQAARYRDANNPTTKVDTARWGEAILLGWADTSEARAAELETEAAAAFAVEPWVCYSWCGRYDLAVKQEASISRRGRHNTMILVAWVTK